MAPQLLKAAPHEETWRGNVAALAHRVDAEVSRTGARMSVLAGEAGARS